MSHLKFTNIPKDWSVKDFISNLSGIIKISDEQLQQIKLIHLDENNREKNYVRIAFNKPELLDVIKQHSFKANRESFKIQMGQNWKYYEVIDNTKEKFKLNSVAKRNDMKNKILMVKINEEQDIFDIAAKVNCDYDMKFKYISYTRSAVFMGFETIEKAKYVKNRFEEEAFKINYSKTYLYLDRYIATSSRNQSSNIERNMQSVSVPFQLPPRPQFPSFNSIHLQQPSNDNINQSTTVKVDLREQLIQKRATTEQENLVQSFVNQSIVISGKTLSDFFDLKLTFIPKS